MTDTESELRESFHAAFDDAEYPIGSQMDLMPALPNGMSSEFSGGDVTISAMELASKAAGHQEFPYESSDALVDALIDALKAEGVL